MPCFAFASGSTCRRCTVTLTICGLVGITGAMWSFFGHVVAGLPAMGEGALLPLLIGTGVTAGAVVSISSPPLAVVCALVGAVGAAMFSDDHDFRRRHGGAVAGDGRL